MKKFLILLFMCLALGVQAEYVLWQVQIDEDARIHNGSESVSLRQFLEKIYRWEHLELEM